MSIQADLYSPATTGGLVWLYKLDGSMLPGDYVYYFSPYVNQYGDAIVWNSQTYMKMPSKGQGWAKTVNGAAPRPTFTVDNTNRLMQAAINASGSFVGAKLTRTLVLGKYLDATNFKGGNPTADPTKFVKQETWYVDQLKESNDKAITWELCWTLDRPGIQLPRRIMLKSQFPGLGMNS